MAPRWSAPRLPVDSSRISRSRRPLPKTHDSQAGSRGRVRASGVAPARPSRRAWSSSRAHGRGHARRADGARLALRGDPSGTRGRGFGRPFGRDPGGRPRRPQPRTGDRAARAECGPAHRGVHVQREHRPAPAGREPCVADPEPGAHRRACVRGRSSCRASCFACCRKESSSLSGARARAGWTCACWRPPTAISKPANAPAGVWRAR